MVRNYLVGYPYLLLGIYLNTEMKENINNHHIKKHLDTLNKNNIISLLTTATYCKANQLTLTSR